MLPPAHPVADAIARLEALIGSLEAGEPVQAIVTSSLERLIGMCSLPVAEDLGEVKATLETLLRDPSARHLPRLRRALDAALAEAPTGPTPSARANALLDLAVAAAAGEAHAEFAAECVDFDAEIAALALRMDALARAGADGRALEEAEGLVAAAEGAREHLAALHEAVARGSEEIVRAAGRGLVGALNTVAQHHRALGRLAEHEGRTPCIRCGCYNLPERSTCEECGAILPAAARTDERVVDVRVGDEGGAQQAQMTENLARLFEACDLYYAGGLEPEGFLDEVARMEGLLGQARKLGLPDGDLARQGAADFEAGLALLRQAGETGDGALLDAGRRMIWEGAGTLQASA